MYTSKYSPVPGAWQRFSATVAFKHYFFYCTMGVALKCSPLSMSTLFFWLCSLWSILTVLHWMVSYLQNLIFYRHFFFVFIVRQKIWPPCNSKTLYVMFTESRQESLEPKVREEISFHLGGKISILLTGLNGLYLLMQIHLLAFPLSGAASHWSD